MRYKALAISQEEERRQEITDSLRNIFLEIDHAVTYAQAVNGPADKKLDREGARMYPYEERMRAVKAYIASGYQANQTIREVGYPSQETLGSWCREYRENGDLYRDFIRVPLHTEEQKATAVAHYYANGYNYTRTSKALGYVDRERLRQWVLQSGPPEGQPCISRQSAVKCTPEQKREAVVEFCARGGSAEKIANRYGVSHFNLYFWRKKLFAGECTAVTFTRKEC